MSKRPPITLRDIIMLLETQSGGSQDFMDMPLLIGVYDGNRNFDHADISRTYPRRLDDGIRIECHLNCKHLRNPAGKRGNM